MLVRARASDLKLCQKILYSQSKMSENLKEVSILCFLLAVDRQLLHNLCWCPADLFTDLSMSTAVSCWEWIMGARQDLELPVRFFLSFNSLHWLILILDNSSYER